MFRHHTSFNLISCASTLGSLSRLVIQFLLDYDPSIHFLPISQWLILDRILLILAVGVASHLISAVLDSFGEIELAVGVADHLASAGFVSGDDFGGISGWCRESCSDGAQKGREEEEGFEVHCVGRRAFSV